MDHISDILNTRFFPALFVRDPRAGQEIGYGVSTDLPGTNKTIVSIHGVDGRGVTSLVELDIFPPFPRITIHHPKTNG